MTPENTDDPAPRRADQAEPAERLPAAVEDLLLRALESGSRLCFGPGFFAAHLGALVRNCCPKPEEALPVVELHLVSGEIIDVCHRRGFVAVETTPEGLLIRSATPVTREVPL